MGLAPLLIGNAKTLEQLWSAAAQAQMIDRKARGITNAVAVEVYDDSSQSVSVI
jgi:hypothetical protein